MAIKKKNENIADQIINGTFNSNKLQNPVEKTNIVERVQQRANNIMNNNITTKSNVNILATKESQKTKTGIWDNVKRRAMSTTNQNMQKARTTQINSNNFLNMSQQDRINNSKINQQRTPFLMNKKNEEKQDNTSQNPLQWKETRKLADISKGLPSAKNVSDETLYNISNIKDKTERDKTIRGLAKSKKEQDKLRTKVNALVQERETSEKANTINSRIETAGFIQNQFNRLTGNKYHLDKAYTGLQAGKRFASSLGQGALNYGLDIAGTMQSLSPQSDDNFVNTAKQLGSRNSQVNAKIKNPVVSGAGRAGETIGFMIPSIVASAVAPESKISGVVNAVGVGSSGYLENLDEEQTNKLESLLTGVAKGAVSYKIEQLSDGNFLSKGKSSLSKEQVKGLSNVSNNMVKWFKAKASEIGGEVVEENLENVAGYIIDYLINEKKITADELIEEAKQTSIDTFTTTALLNVLGLGGNTYRQSQQYETSRDLLFNTNLDNTAKDIILNDVLEGKRTSNDIFALLYGQSDTELNNQIIDSSKMDENSKQAMKKVAEENELGINEVQYLIDNTLQGKYVQNQSTTMQNKEVSQNNQQVIQTDIKTAQNRLSQETEGIEQKVLNLRQSIDNYNNSRAEGQEIFDINNEETRKEIEAIQKVVEDRNINIRFDENRFKDDSQNAFYEYDENGNVANIILNPNATTKKYVENLAIHELVHSFCGDQKANLMKDVLNYAKTLEGYDKAYQDIKSNYEKVYGKNVSEDVINEEVVANILGEKLGNKEFVNDLVNVKYSTQNRNFVQKIYDFVKNQINKFKGYKNQEQYWTHIKELFDDAYRNSEVSQEGIKASVERNITDNKQKQLDIIKESNPMTDEYHTGIRTIDDIKTFEEAIQDEESFVYGDYSKEDAERDLKNGTVTVYSSKPIEQGGFVSTSKNMAKDYAGNGQVYSQKVNINDVAWINGDEGQYAKIEQTSTKDSKGRELSKGQQEYFKNVSPELKDENGNLKRFYHGTNSDFTVFDLSKGGQSNSGASIGFWFTETKEGAEKFANDVWYGDKKPNTKEVYLDIKNPKIYENVKNEEQEQFYKDKSEELEKKAKELKKKYSWDNTDYKTAMTFDSLIRDYHYARIKNESVDLDMFERLAEGRGFSKEQISEMKNDATEYDKIIAESKEAKNEYYKLRYNDAYEQFKIDLYEVAGQSAEEANTGGLGMALNNPKETVEKFRQKLIAEGYDGIIIKRTQFDKGNFNGENNQYVIFNSNQAKNIDNTNPTTNPDIRYSQDTTGAWNNFIEKYFKNEGTGTAIKDMKKLPEMSITKYQEVLDNAKHIPQEEKTYLLETVKDIKRNKTSLEDFKNTIETMEKAYDEQNENILDTKKTYNTGRREIYQKYMKAKGEYDTSSLDNAKEIIPANKQGRRTKSQWLNIAKQIGTEIADKSNAEIEEIAYRTWQDERPSNKESLNRQGEKFVTFTSDEWINTIYDTVKEQRGKYSIDTGENTQVQDENVKEEPKRKIVDEVYKEEINDGKTRKHYKSIFESDQIGKTGKDVAKELYKTDTYIPISNLDTMTEANKNIERNGVEDTYTAFRTKLRTNEKITLQDIATGERLIQIYSQNGDYQKVNDLIQDVAILGTELGQQVQAFSLIKKASPEGQLQYLKKLVDRTNIKEDTDIKVTEDMTKKILESKNENELEKNMSDVAVEIAEQLPISRRDKIRSWRYLSMLGNPKTHIKNVGANVFMNLTQSAKNIVAGGVEDVVGTFNKNLEKTKTLKPANKEQKNFAKQDAEYMQDLIDGGGKFDVGNIIQNNKKQFNNKMLNKIAEFNSDMLDVEDKIFLKLAYKQAMQNYMSANKLKANDMQGKILEKARQYASIQAQEATFHQFNALANTLNQVENRGGFFGKAVEATLPFKKTPMNIAKEGLEYSPVGLAKFVTYDLGQLATKTKAYKKQLKEGKITQEQYKAETSKLATKTIDNFAKGFTGSSIAVLGYFLSQAGILKAGNDGDDDEFKESLGEQEYAIKIGDNTYTLDWISPSAIPLFTGATIQQLRSGEIRADGSLINSTMTGLAKSFEPMTEMSMLQGLTSAISSYEKSSNMFFDLLSSMTTSYLGQFVPTALGQVARTIDPYERDTSTTKKGIESKTDRFLKQTMNKIPGMSQKLPVKKDVWGNDKKRVNNVGVRLLENAILPFNRKELIEDRTDKELLKVFDETGEKILPSAPSKDLTINKQKYRMTSKEYNEARKTFGQTSKKLLDDLFSSKDYLSLSSEGRAKAIQDVYSYAKEELKKQYADSKGQELKTSKLYNTVSELKEQKGNVSAYFEFKGKLDDLDRANGEESLKDKQKLEYLGKLKENDSTKRIIYEDTFGTKDKVYSGLKKLTNNAVSINDYLNYKISDFSADKEDDGTLNGKTISGSAKQKVVDFINNSNFSDIEKLYLRGTKNKLDNSQRKQFAEYISALDLNDEEIKEIYLSLNGVAEMKDGSIIWK